MPASEQSLVKAYRLFMRQIARQQRASQEQQRASQAARAAAQIALSARSAPQSDTAVAAAGPETLAARQARAPVDALALKVFGARVRAQVVSPAYIAEAAAFLANQREYLHLLERYGNGAEDTSERVRLTARRVGLDISQL